MSQQPSIFNDVLGPVMRGPSSSHTAASWRIGKLAVALLGEDVKDVLVEFDVDGAWAPNYEEQGTVLGMNGGLLDIDITDELIVDNSSAAAARGVDISYRIASFPTTHANTARLTLTGATGRRLILVGVSLGGGMFEARMLNGHSISIQGDYHELIGFLSENPSAAQKEQIDSIVGKKGIIQWCTDSSKNFFEVKSSERLPDALVAELDASGSFEYIARCQPLLPIVSGRSQALSFGTYQELISFDVSQNSSQNPSQNGSTNGAVTSSLGSLGMLYEQQRSGLAEADVLSKMENLVGIIEASIATGLAGTQYDDRILQQQSHLIGVAEKEGRLPTDSLVNRIIENISAIMEAKSAMHVIVAAPTAGGCGTLGGVIKAVSDARGTSADAKVKAYFAAGLVGVFLAQGPGFSAEEGGCQLETGAAAAMAAAALVDLSGGTATQALAAASMALQNTIGLVCDPVADRVEVPCLGKNITAGVNALAASAMALSGFLHVIPLDQVIETVKNVAATMPSSLCCTGLGGLAATETSAQIKTMLKQKCANC